jgi:hypothetical protein
MEESEVPMKRVIVLSLLAISLLLLAVSAEASVRIGAGFGYRGPVFLSGPSLYCAIPVRSANSGELKVDTSAKDASVYINGSYAGTVKALKSVRLRSGTYDIEVRTTNGGVFNQKVFVPVDKKVVVEPIFSAS